MLDVTGNGRYARKIAVACRRERACRLHRLAPSPQDLDQLVRADPSSKSAPKRSARGHNLITASYEMQVSSPSMTIGHPNPRHLAPTCYC
jgi:hypothetical protein